MSRDAILDDAQLSFASEQRFRRSYRFAVAGNDEIEVTEIRVYVECETVRRHPTRDVDADGRHFPALGVYAG